ncbi:MAG: hypothetical protein K9W43_13930 [Candidatus Thorarchaeota archaeon]|nr:hypothetical protein [Candidatus Thorarchaeota archaeon]
MQLEPTLGTRSLTVFTPPGITVEPAKYPTMFVGVLASTHPSQHISIYDHPRAWKGFSRDAIRHMRERLYRFLVPIDARDMFPRETLDTLRTIALSVTPLALGVETPSLPPRRLRPLAGILPAGPNVIVQDIEILSEPEISHVAQKICEKDIPASEGAWQLLDYDYSLDQVVRLMSLGMLGRLDKRRLVQTRSAYKVIIDAYIERAIAGLREQPISEGYRIHIANYYGDSFIIITRPGEARVDYIRAEKTTTGFQILADLEDSKSIANPPKLSVLADHARFAAYRTMREEQQSSHVIILHSNVEPNNNDLEPWLTRFGVAQAMQAQPALLDSVDNVLAILQTILRPNLRLWDEHTPLLKRLAKN